MRLNDLLAKYPGPALQGGGGDAVFRRSVWTPFFENLHENKVIYCERFICLAKIENLTITDIGVGGLIVPLKYLYVPDYIHGAPKKELGIWWRLGTHDAGSGNPWVQIFRVDHLARSGARTGHRDASFPR